MRWKCVVIVALLVTGAVSLCRGQENGPSERAPAGQIGLEVGRKAPAFSSTDQFGHGESNETLVGSHGTLLLFFRSADW